MIVVDTSASVKLLVDEEESAAVEGFVRDAAAAGTALVVSQIGVTELRRAAIRLGLASDAPTPVVRLFTVVRLTDAVLHLAGRLPHPHLRTLDVLHLSTALVLGADALVTYDDRLADAAGREGVDVLRPGR